jgi:PilZ domain
MMIADKILSGASCVQHEKRVFSRIECLVDLEVQGAGENDDASETVEAIDLSLLGVGFERKPGQPELRLGETVTVSLGGIGPLNAKVRWNRGLRVGVQFCGRFQDIVESWVGEVLSAQGVRIRDILNLG